MCPVYVRVWFCQTNIDTCPRKLAKVTFYYNPLLTLVFEDQETITKTPLTHFHWCKILQQKPKQCDNLIITLSSQSSDTWNKHYGPMTNGQGAKNNKNIIRHHTIKSFLGWRGEKRIEIKLWMYRAGSGAASACVQCPDVCRQTRKSILMLEQQCKYTLELLNLLSKQSGSKTQCQDEEEARQAATVGCSQTESELDVKWFTLGQSNLDLFGSPTQDSGAVFAKKLTKVYFHQFLHCSSSGNVITGNWL